MSHPSSGSSHLRGSAGVSLGGKGVITALSMAGSKRWKHLSQNYCIWGCEMPLSLLYLQALSWQKAGADRSHCMSPPEVLPGSQVSLPSSELCTRWGCREPPRCWGWQWLPVTVAWEWKITERCAQLPHYRTKARLSKAVIWGCSTPPDIKSFHFVLRSPHCPFCLTQVPLWFHVIRDKKICFQGLEKNPSK